MKRKKSKRLISMLMCVCMLVILVPMAAFAADLPEGPIVGGDVWTVDPENAQYTLDGAYGSIDGKTIHFSGGTIPKYLYWLVLQSTMEATRNTTT